MSELLSVVQSTFQLRRCSPGDLCKLYEVSDKTMNKWLAPFREEIGPRQGLYYTIHQVRVIVSRLGLPGSIVAE